MENPDLARSLERIAKDGAEVFYRGELAERIVADLLKAAGVIEVDAPSGGREGQALGHLDGQLSVLFVMVVAAAEVTVGLAIIVMVFRKRSTASVDELAGMKG